MFTIAAYGIPGPVNESVIQKFKTNFPTASNVKWYEGKDYYQVTYMQDNIKTSLYYNNDDEIYRTIRYFDETYLPPFVTLRIKNKFENKSIHSVTEYSDRNEGFKYQIVLEDADNLFIVQCDSHGNINSKKKLIKSK